MRRIANSDPSAPIMEPLSISSFLMASSNRQYALPVEAVAECALIGVDQIAANAADLGIGEVASEIAHASQIHR